MQISQISELSGYSQRMIRYLEDQGLISPQRSDSNLRKFSDRDLTRVLKIKRLKDLGFTYLEIKDLVDKDENALVSKGSDLLKRHHAEAHELVEKIQQLERLCYGKTKTNSVPELATTLSHPQRTAYRIHKLELLAEALQRLEPQAISEVVLWKFREYLNMPDRETLGSIEVAEIFRGSSQIVVLEGSKFLPIYEQAWKETALPFYMKSIGSFPAAELKEFFGSFEIVMEHKITHASGKIIFKALLPYQAIYIASGESIV